MNFDQTYILDFAKRLLATHSPSGYTQNAIAFIEQEIANWNYASYRTNKGNLVIVVDGEDNESAVGLCAHTDTLGLMVRSVSGDGKLQVTNLGGPLMPTLDGEYCTIITREGRKFTGTILSKSPAAHVYKDASSAARNTDTMEVRIDEVVKSKQDVNALGIFPGDFVCIDPKTQITDSGFIKSRFLDDKLSVAILFSVLKELKEKNIKPKHNIIMIISTYEEIGHGSSNIPSEISELIAVDMGCIGKDLSCTEFDVSICAKDSSGPYDYDITGRLIELAKKHNLKYAVDIYPYYGSDVSAALRGGNNIRGGLIGPGVHASHGMERSHADAVENTLKLLMAYICE